MSILEEEQIMDAIPVMQVSHCFDIQCHVYDGFINICCAVT